MSKIHSSINYFVKDARHQGEKPYELRYDAGGAIPNTNMQDEPREVVVEDYRPLQTPTSFSDVGFMCARLEGVLEAAKFDDDEAVRQRYYPEVQRLLRRLFPSADNVKILEHGLRKRHVRFPAGELFETVQPSTIAHIDYSAISAVRTARAAFGVEPGQYRRLVTVNVWKRLQGPGDDWPLALCDWRTLDRRADSIPVDVVYEDRYTENESLYYNPKHRWYWFKDLADDEVIVFQQSDTDDEGAGGVAHSSFYNPTAARDARPRASVELRAFILYH